MSPIPFISLGISLIFATLAWRRREDFAAKPYFHWFIYFHLTAVGLHQFEEYGWPGGFRDVFVSVFSISEAQALIPPDLTLELLNAFGFTLLFGIVGWFGTRLIWLGMGLLYTNFSNAFFHLVYSVTHMTYVPGTVTGALLYLPLGLLATRYVVLQDDLDGRTLLLAFAAGALLSFAPFIHVWMLYWLK